MEINGESVTIFGGVLAILGIIVNLFRVIFKKFSKIEQLEDRADKQDTEIQAIKDSEIKEIRNDIRKLEKDFQDLKSTIETAIVQGNASIEKTVSDLHIKLLDKINEIKSNSND